MPHGIQPDSCLGQQGQFLLHFLEHDGGFAELAGVGVGDPKMSRTPK